MEEIEIYQEGDITYTVYDNSMERQLNDWYNAVYLRDATARFQHLQRIDNLQKNCKYIFLTINPDPNHITFNDFQKCIHKMMGKPWITNYLYVFEQRGEDFLSCGNGFHYHAIIEKPLNKSYAHMVRELSSTANKVCDTSNYHYFNLKNISEEEKDRKIKYITGRKADPAKWLKQDMDIQFRKENKLLSYYSVGIEPDAIQETPV